MPFRQLFARGAAVPTALSFVQSGFRNASTRARRQPQMYAWNAVYPTEERKWVGEDPELVRPVHRCESPAVEESLLIGEMKRVLGDLKDRPPSPPESPVLEEKHPVVSSAPTAPFYDSFPENHFTYAVHTHPPQIEEPAMVLNEGERHEGIVDVLKGSYGFIRPMDGSGKRIFFCRRDLKKSKHLFAGDRVSFKLTIGKKSGKPVAKQIQRAPTVP